MVLRLCTHIFTLISSFGSLYPQTANALVTSTTFCITGNYSEVASKEHLPDLYLKEASSILNFIEEIAISTSNSPKLTLLENFPLRASEERTISHSVYSFCALNLHFILFLSVALILGIYIGRSRKLNEGLAHSIQTGYSPRHCTAQADSEGFTQLIDDTEQLSPIHTTESALVPFRVPSILHTDFFFPQTLRERQTRIIVKTINGALVFEESLPHYQNNPPAEPQSRRTRLGLAASTRNSTEYSTIYDVLNNGNYERQFIFERKLGKGGFGSVELAQHKLEGEHYAIKKVRMKVGVNQQIHRHKFFKEVKTLMKLQSKHVVRYSTCWVEEDNLLDSSSESSIFSADPEVPVKHEESCMNLVLYIQMEYCEGMTLADWIRTRPGTELPMTKQITTQILRGVKYIHKKRVIHRDIKPDNIFIDGRGTVKIGDFNLATMLVPDNRSLRLSTGVGTPFYLAPEQEFSNVYHSKVDVYPVGIILFEMLNLFSTAHERVNALKGIRNRGTFPEEFIGKFPVETELLKWLLSEDPIDRPEAAEVLSSALFANWLV